MNLFPLALCLILVIPIPSLMATGNPGDHCTYDTCMEGLSCCGKGDCLVKGAANKGVCREANAYGEFRTKNYCAPMGNWPGGLNSGINGYCKCYESATSWCQKNSQCCSGKCAQSGQCAPPQLGDKCVSGSCALGLACSEAGLCITPEPLYSYCDTNTVCAGIGHWPGGLGNCNQGECRCKIAEKCTNNHECCSGLCGYDTCASGGDGDLCVKDSCAAGYGLSCYQTGADGVREAVVDYATHGQCMHM